MKYIGYILSACAFLLASCTQEWETPFTPGNGEEGPVRIQLIPEGMTLVETRAENQEEVEADSRIEHVAIYAFDAEGNYVTSYEQDLEHPDNEVSLILPQNEGTLTLHAVCNYTNMPATVTEESELDNIFIDITEADGAFNGSMVMHGKATISQDEITSKIPKDIKVKRIAAKIDFTLLFAPEVPGDQFMLSRVTVHNIPMRSYLLERTSNVDHGVEQVDEDDTYHNPDENESEETSNCQDAAFTEAQKSYNDSYLLQTTGDINDAKGATARFYMFENRRGAVTEESSFNTTYPDKDDWQYLKGEMAKKFEYATYIEIEGVYKFKSGTTMQASYKIYLGKNNYGDFNVFRNCHHTYQVTIKTCTTADTRVTAVNLNSAQITEAFNDPLDAHFNAGRCLGYTANGEWELYVEDPDEHPWLEISFSPQYRPHIPGKTYRDADGNPINDNLIAATRFEGDGTVPLAQYFYVHTDEFVPENPAANEALNNTTKPESWRTGTIILRDLTNGSEDRIEVRQRPAQVVKMPVYDLLGRVEFYNEYFVEYELEQKNITWGFLRYGANPVMTSMINDRWDGLSNTRKLYQEAIKIPEDPEDDSEDSGIYWGAYNGYYTVEDTYPRLEDMQEIIDRIPDDHMIKYVLSKNRDRNGNGYIDYDEIVWYVPALDELAELYKAMHGVGRQHVFFQNSEDRFHSSTPYLAGYTAEVPGRAFYVKMGDEGEKAFAMRDRQYNVICCRRKGAWTGNADSEFKGDVTENEEWNEDETDIMPK